MHDIFYLSAACSRANTVLQIFGILSVPKEHGLFRDMKKCIPSRIPGKKRRDEPDFS